MLRNSIKKYVAVAGFFFASISLSVAQQDVQYTQYMLNSLYVNPASAGIDGMTKFHGIYRNQYTTLSGGPTSFIIAGQTKIHAINSGVGLYVQNDQIGANNNYNVMLNYSYHLDLGDGKLGIGASLGGIINQLDKDKLIANDMINDPRLNEISGQRQTALDFGLGLWYQKEKYYIGVSTSHLNTPSFYKSNKTNNASKIVPHLFLTGGYNFDLSDKFKLTPSAIVKTDLKSTKASSFEISSLLKYDNEKFWGGLSFRNGDAVSAIVGVGLLKDNALKIGYAFDLIIIGKDAKASTSNEIFMSYSIPVKLPKPSPAIRTPRFRF